MSRFISRKTLGCVIWFQICTFPALMITWAGSLFESAPDNL